MALPLKVFDPDKAGFVSGVDRMCGTVFTVALSAFVNKDGLIGGGGGSVAYRYKQECAWQDKGEPDVKDAGF